ncbi:NADH-quinone oxidoreductase subunit NuoK [Candidatus Bathyarchaeota archaeon]|nr:NADH-quinone oxidoreductase subunit NuoK [Candidatus Bathyarchaeota archaeon]
MIPLVYYLAGAVALYIIGMYCLASKRNMIRLVIGVEILMNAANLTFIAFSAYRTPGHIDPLGHAIAIMSIVFAGCVTAVALTIVTYAYRHYGTLDVRKLRRLRW